MDDLDTQTADGATAGADDGVTLSLADRIVDFDLSPYLEEPMKSWWIWLQDYQLAFAIFLVLLGYGIGRILKAVIHVLLDRMRKSRKSHLDYQIAHYLSSPILQTTVTLFIILAVVALDFPASMERLLVKLCFTVLLVLWGRAWFKAAKAILQALEEGHFYASSGPQILDLHLDEGGDWLHVHCSPSTVIDFVGPGPASHRVAAPAGGTLEKASYRLWKGQGYLRVACQDVQGRWAWTNPLFLDPR